jgi:DNA replication protein DnaC
MKRYQGAQLLLLDDFLKPGRDRKGNEEGASAADMRLAFDLLNARYLNRLPTIISSEWHIGELAEMDEATASRIYERCGEFMVNIKRAAGRNWRFRNMKMV